MALGHIQLTPQLVQAVRDAVDIVDIAGEHTRLRKSGRRHMGRCPLHREKTPSFSVDPVQGLFYCFGCGRGGDAIKLHMLLSGDDFPAAIETLARRYGIPLPPPRQQERGPREPDLEPALEAAARFFVEALARSPQTQAYLEKRRIPRELVERFGIGYAPEGWTHLLEALHSRIPLSDLKAAGLVALSQKTGKYYDRFRQRLMFPVRAASGRLLGFGGRTLADDPAKYINSHETAAFRKGNILYGLDLSKRAIRESSTAVLVEGYFDVLGAVASGVEGTVATMGTALTEEQARMLSRFASDVVVGYDGDEAGEQAFRRALPLLLSQGLTVRRARFGEDQDPDSLRTSLGPEAVFKAISEAQDGVLLELERLIPVAVHQSPRLQAEAGKRVAELLRSVPDAILRYSYSQKAADRLGVPVEILWRRVAGRKDQEAKGAPSTVSRNGPKMVRSLEEQALQLLLTGEEELPPPAELPPPEVFLIAGCRNIYRAFCDLYRDGGGRRPAAKEVLAGIPLDSEEVDQMARLLLEGSIAEKATDLTRALGRLNRRWLQQRLRVLSKEISEAQQAGDAGRLRVLLEDKTALSRALHRGSRED